MTFQGWALIVLFVIVLVALAKPVGLWLFALYEGRRTPLHFILGPVERGFYRLAGIDSGHDQGWRRYALHMLAFNLALLLFTYAVLRLQAMLPLNPRGGSPQWERTVRSTLRSASPPTPTGNGIRERRRFRT